MPSPDPGSFRDPSSRVVFDGDRVLRLLDDRGLRSWQDLTSSDFFGRATADGRLIEAHETENPGEGAVGALEHPRLPFISYPYEWTFSMLKNAALLQLGLLEEALGEGLTIKDATPFNIQFLDGHPIFIDIGSFERYQPGEPWIGYRQFTRQFLFPLMLRSWAGLPFHPWLRGDMEGPSAADMKRILSRGQRMKPAAMMHVTLQARMEERMSGEAVRSNLREAGFSSDLIVANVGKLRSLVESLHWEQEDAGWSGYHSFDHVARDRDDKAGFLRESLQARQPGRVLDLGANDGHFSAIAAEHGALAIAVDGHEPVLDSLYKQSAGSSIAVVVSDLTNPSPSQGWAGTERPSLMERANPDLIVAYGVIHHLMYTASIPPRSILKWLRDFEAPVVLEFVSPEDPMVDKLTANKLESELHAGRDEPAFRQLLAAHFEIRREKVLEGSTRILFDLVPSGR